MDSEIASVHFVDGCVIEHDYVYVSTAADDLDPIEVDFSRLFFNDRGEWVHHDLEWAVVSVCVQRAAEPRRYAALSRQGDVEFQFVGGSSVETIPDAGVYDGAGAMTQIREIGGVLVACGYGGQVYVRDPGGWRPLGGGLAHLSTADRPAHITSIDGTGTDDVYAVGFHGRIFHFDGSAWSELDSPVRVHLERVRASGGRIYVCGNDATVLCGDRAGFDILPIEGFSAHLWGIERFGDETYVAHLDGLLVHDGTAWSPVDMRLRDARSPEDGYRLDAFDGVLWSFGPKRVAWFDGTTWTEMPHPDN